MCENHGVITKLIGVYDADGTWWGEVSYWVGSLFGQAHCSLCEITHSRWRRRADWEECRLGLPVEFVTRHRDEMTDVVINLPDVKFPCVIAQTANSSMVLLSPEEIASCSGSASALVAKIERVVQEKGLSWSSTP